MKGKARSGPRKKSAGSVVKARRKTAPKKIPFQEADIIAFMRFVRRYDLRKEAHKLLSDRLSRA